MSSDTDNKIQEIINSRRAQVSEITAQKSKWGGGEIYNVSPVKQSLSSLKALCRQALSADSSLSPQIEKLQRSIAEIEQQSLTEVMESACRDANAEIDNLSKRFCRDTINIAVAGVGRSGKSTALKSIIGLEQEDNSVIPSGSGPAVTAGKSCIHSVATPQEEHSIIEFHTEESFLENLVNPSVGVVSFGECRCTDLYDFQVLDLDELEKKYITNRSAAERVRLEKADKDMITDSTEARRTQLKALRKIRESFDAIKAHLTGEKKQVPLEQTSQYVTYQYENGKPDVCFAVKEAHIYTQFPNNTVRSLQLIDLPGLGTSSLSEKKCFFNGFDYSVDLALLLRRPEGITQNFPSELDINVIGLLEDAFGDKHLHEVAYLFQNDANLPADGAQKSFAEVEKWNRDRKQNLDVIRGDASSAEFMQKTLLPKILNFLTENLPRFDRNMLEDALKTIKESEAKYNDALDKIAAALKPSQRDFKSGSNTNAVRKKVKEIRDKIRNELTRLRGKYTDPKGMTYVKMNEEIRRITTELKKELSARYTEQNSDTLQEVKDSILECHTANNWATDHYHAVRIQISEKYSDLKDIHQLLVGEMQNDVYKILSHSFGRQFADQGCLDDVEKAFLEANCPELSDSVKDLSTLTVPFYNLIYPDLLHNVFEDVTDASVDAFLKQVMSIHPGEKQAGQVLQTLLNKSMKWIAQTEETLYREIKIAGILFAALSRFEDRITRNEKTNDELHDFVEDNSGAVLDDKNAYMENISARIQDIQNLRN